MTTPFQVVIERIIKRLERTRGRSESEENRLVALKNILARYQQHRGNGDDEAGGIPRKV